MSYPSWICYECGEKYGHALDGSCATFHYADQNDPNDKCGWCGTQDRPLTEPRDYKFPPILELAI